MPLPEVSRSAIYLLIALVATTVAIAVLLGIAAPRIDSLPLQVKNKDFANYWMAGRLALSGDGPTLFGKPAEYFEAMRAVFGADYPWHNWSYPPHAVLFLLPLGMLGFLPAMAIFLGLTLTLYVLAVQSLRPHWSPIAGILLLPFIVANLVATQNGFLTAALTIGGLALRGRAPVAAGIMFGLLTFKPQLGFLLPVLLLCERRWLVIAVAAVTAIVLVLVSVMAFGMESWIDYIRYVAPYQTEVMNNLGGDFPRMMGSTFGSARSLGLDAATAMWLHLPFAAAGFVLLLFGLWRLEDFHARAFVTLIATMLIVPYSVAYDFGAVATYAALWPIDRGRPQPGLLTRLPLILTAVLPIAMLPMGQAGLPLTPFILLAAMTMLLAERGALRLNETSATLPRQSREQRG
jgi:hypothetical protein